MNKELSLRVGAVMLTDTIQRLTTPEKIQWLFSLDKAGSFKTLQGSPKDLLLSAEQSNEQ